MQHQEKYSLHWDSYSDHLKEALNNMMLSSEFADVTLVTDDKQQIRAHRNILSAASPVFKSILQIDSKNANPVIYLRGIQHSEMESIMQFIYLGEGRCYEERMTEFFHVSKNLEIKGLLTGSGIEIKGQSSSDEISIEQEINITDDENVSKDPVENFIDNVNNDERETQTLTKQIIRNPVKELLINNVAPSDEEINEYEDNVLHESVGEDTDSVNYACKHCDKKYPTAGNLKRHIQSKHEGVKYPCNQCDYQATDKSNLTTHIKSIH